MTSGASSRAARATSSAAHPGVAGVEHADVVAGPAQHRGERLDSQGREGHDPDARTRAARVTGRRREEVEVRLVPHVHQENAQGGKLDDPGPIRQGCSPKCRLTLEGPGA